VTEKHLSFGVDSAVAIKADLRVKATGEVFTPRSLIREMLDRLPNSAWFDPNKRWLEPAAGDGNFLVEIKARLRQAGHDEIHILENMLFSIELIDDNHWALQHRLGYLIDGQPNPRLDSENFAISKISQLTQDLNDKNPYVAIGCARDEVLHHRNHVCASGLEYDMSFGRTDDEFTPVLYVLDERDLGAWPETDTPDVGERYVVERMLGKQPQLQHETVNDLPTPKPVKVVNKEPKAFVDLPELADLVKMALRAYKHPKQRATFVEQRLMVLKKIKKIDDRLKARITELVNV
jgi:hypothetical protein